MNELRKNKTELREFYMQKRAEIPDDIKTDFNNKITEHFLNSVSYRHADIILIYNSNKNEIDTSVIIRKTLEQNKKIACPVSDTETNTLTFKIINTPDDLQVGAYNLLEPKDECVDFMEYKNKSNQNVLSLCVAPGIVFDKKGYRIGYGKGYYDRFLSEFEGAKIGFCYSSLIVNELPRGKYDVKSDAIITEKGIFIPS